MVTQRLSPLSIVFHWLVFLLFLVALASIEYREFVASGDPLRATLRSTHVLFGQLILIASIVRLYVRIRFASVPHNSATPAWMSRGAMGVHTLLYGVMLLQPLLGILSMQTGDKSVMFFSWTLPQLMEPNTLLHFSLKDAHKAVATAFYVLIAMHIAGALVHHFVVKDSTLRRMFTLRNKS